jgi:hypothetical protein
MDGAKTHDNESKETIDIPLPTDEQWRRALSGSADTSVEIDEVSKQDGHFSVDYRRC